MIKQISIVSIIFIALSCSQLKNEPTHIDDDNILSIKAIDLDKEIVTNPDLCNVEIIELESSKRDQLIGDIHKIIYNNGFFYILDSHIAKAIYIFDRNGRFIKRIRRRGRGPGEYNECFDMDVDKEGNIYIMDVNLAKIIKYNSQGKFLAEYPYHFWSYNFCHVRTDTFAFFQFNRQNTLKELGFGLLYWTGDQVITKNYFPYKYRDGEKGSVTLNSSFFQRTGHSVLFSRSLSDTIFEVLPDGLKSKYVIDFGHNKLGVDIINIEKAEEKVKALFESQYAYNLHNYFETDSAFICSFFYHREVCLLVYNKGTKESKFYAFTGITGRETAGFKPYSLCEGKIVSYFNPTSLSRGKNEYFVGQLGLMDDELGESEDGNVKNPCIVLYDIKE